jgi:hypothetical protein
MFVRSIYVNLAIENTCVKALFSCGYLFHRFELALNPLTFVLAAAYTLLYAEFFLGGLNVIAEIFVLENGC